MKFSEENSGATYRITGYDTHWIRINEFALQRSFILSPNTLIRDWQPTHINELTVEDLTPLFELKPNVILIGTGTTQHFPSADVWRALVEHGIGFEVMKTDAACRTYNVLLSEARQVAAAFFL